MPYIALFLKEKSKNLEALGASFLEPSRAPSSPRCYW